MYTRILADKIRNKKCFSERYSVLTRLDFFKPSERRYPCTKSPAFTNSACCSIVHFCRCNTHVSAGCQPLRLPCICIFRCCNTHVSAGCQSRQIYPSVEQKSCNTHISVLLTFKDVSLLREDKRKPSEAESPRVFYSTFANTAKKRQPISRLSQNLERMTRLELATSTLARWRSTR